MTLVWPYRANAFLISEAAGGEIKMPEESAEKYLKDIGLYDEKPVMETISLCWHEPVNVAAFAADIAECSALSEPFKPEETRSRIIHCNRAFEELASAAMMTRELLIVDRYFTRSIGHRTPPGDSAERLKQSCRRTLIIAS